jgi:polysaccharide chain length determinant protein (PEP-CTERM system associated)
MTKPNYDQPVNQLLQYWQTIRQDKWWIALLSVGLSLASVVAIALIPDEYQATTTILLDPQKVSDQYVTPEVKETFTDRLQTISQQVLSSSQLEDIIQRYELYPRLRKSLSREQMIDYMRKAVNIEVKQASGTGPGAFTITYTGDNPVIVAQVANELAGRFINWNVANREELAQFTTEFLGDQLQGAKKNLEGQENTVRQFKMSHLGEMPDNLPANLGTLAQLRATFQANNDAMNRLEQERMELTHAPAAVLAQPNPYSTPMTERARLEMEKLQLEGQLMDLRRRYTPAHPEVVELTARLQRVKQQLKSLPANDVNGTPEVAEGSSPAEVRLEIIAKEMARLNNEQKQITQQIAAYQAKVDAVPMREQQLADLTRDYDISKEEYKTLLSKKYSADMASELEQKQKGERFTILDPARPPEKPSKPNRPLLILASTIASIVASVLLVLGKEQLNTTVKAEQQLEELLPAQVVLLASIPSIDCPADQQRRRRFAIFALTTSLLACLLVAGFLWRVHPNL